MPSHDALPISLYRPPIVLVVEGRPTTRAVTCRLLRALGYDARAAKEGQQALQMARQYPGLFQLVLGSATLPDMDGGELARRMKEHDPACRVALIADYVPLGRAAKVLAEHPDLPVVRKPFGFRELYEVLTPVLGPGRATITLAGALRPLRRRDRKFVR
jgi:CheY-like chemotaxis protein